MAQNADPQWPKKCPHAICATPFGQNGSGYSKSGFYKHLKRSHPTRCNNAGCSECLRVFLKAELGPQLGKRHARAPSEYRIPGAKRKKLEHSEAQEAGSDDVADMEIDDDVFTPQSLSAPPLIPVKQETVQVRRAVAPIQHVTPRHARRRRSDVWKWLRDRLPGSTVQEITLELYSTDKLRNEVLDELLQHENQRARALDILGASTSMRQRSPAACVGLADDVGLPDQQYQDLRNLSSEFKDSTRADHDDR